MVVEAVDVLEKDSLFVDLATGLMTPLLIMTLTGLIQVTPVLIGVISPVPKSHEPPMPTLNLP